MAAPSPADSATSLFQRHLLALSNEFERLSAENAELRKKVANTGSETRSKKHSSDTFPDSSEALWQLRSWDVTSSPKPPITQDLKYLEEPTSPKCPDKSLDHTSATHTIREDERQAIGIPGAVVEEIGQADSVDSQGTSSSLPRTPKGPDGQPSEMRNSGARHVKDIEDVEESEESATFLLLLDAIPALVILASAAVAGINADYAVNHWIWDVLEALFTAFFTAEILVKLKVFGCKGFFWGADWYWSWFDLLCVVLALVEMIITYTGRTLGAVGILKMLKLARLGRIIRLLKFKIFQELKLMIQGVFTGLRVLFWAVVLLLGCVYLLGVVTRTIFTDRPEFNSVGQAMFTSFRCFTDGCSTYEGAPLQEKLFEEHGGLFMLVYILLFLFVTIGIFNLIMAVFIDNVTDGSTKKRQRELGLNAPRTGWVIASELRHLILSRFLYKEAEDEVDAEDGNEVDRPRRVSKIFKEKVQNLREMYGYKPHTTQEYDDLTDQIREEMANRKIVVTRTEFNHWLSTEKPLLETLNDAEIDLSCKSDLFDVLDADLSGELEFEEMVDGLLKCRGPASKTDIIAIRLKTRLLVRLMIRICEKFDIDV